MYGKEKMGYEMAYVLYIAKGNLRMIIRALKIRSKL